MTLETLIQDVPSVQDAHAIADRLVGAFPSIEAVLLCGSVARGDADNWSDIDLVVIGSDTELTASQLRQELPEWNDRVSLIYYPMSSFQKLYQESTLFVAHLKRERVVLYDRLNLLTNLLKDSSQRTVDIAEEIRAHRAKLAPYTDPQPFNNNFLFCLSHLYSIGKGVIMLSLAKRGIFEFNRASAFRQFSLLNPDLAKEAETVAQLRPFYHLVTGRRPEPLPFSYRAADRQMEMAVQAIQTLADRAEKP